MRNTEAAGPGLPPRDALEQIWLRSPLSHLEIAAGIRDETVIRFARARQGDHVAEKIPRRFLVASLTKPVVALLAMQFVCEGRIGLTDRVGDCLPAFASGRFRRITVRHLLTHSSGLPDMLPENEELRASHAPLSEFVARTAEVVPEFAVATSTRYSSMGFAVLGELLQQAGQAPLRQLLHRTILQPLQMNSTWLGLPEDRAELLETVLRNELPRWQPDDADWNWNSRYWRQLGAPWGGLITTATDLARLSAEVLRCQRNADGIFSLSATGTAETLRNQLRDLPEIPETMRRCRSWGYGWRHNWPGHTACFCDLLPATAAGHWGATGTLWWLEPQSGCWAVLLSTTPYEVSRAALQRMSNVIFAALSDVAYSRE